MHTIKISRHALCSHGSSAKYKNSVDTLEIRSFRGAIVSHVDRRMFVKTGSITKAAIEEVNRYQLTNKLRELAVGIKTELTDKGYSKPNCFLSL